MKKPALIGKYGETEIKKAIENGELGYWQNVEEWCKKTGRCGDEKNVREALCYILRRDYGATHC